MAILFRKSLVRIIPLLWGLVGSTLADIALIDDDTLGVGDFQDGDDMSHDDAGARNSFHRKDAYSTINGQDVKISCTTARNMDGECMPFGDCYPIFKLRDQSGGSVGGNQPTSYAYSDRENRVTDELQSIYRAVSGSCSNFVLQAISQALGYEVPKEKYVCCPMAANFTRVQRPFNRQPPAYNPAAYQNQQCGTYTSRAENETNDDDTIDYRPAEGRIVNGRPTGRNEFPWTVAMMLNGRQFCGGSLIDANHVLTAAHCVYFMNGQDVKRLRLQIGDFNIYSTDDGAHENRGASNVFYHRAFNMRSLTDDVAVIRLSSGVYFNRNIQPICLSSNSWVWESYTASVAGWGQVSERGQQSAVLRTVNVRIWRQNDCARKYRGMTPSGITNGMVCAGGEGYDSCKGDSGGPLNGWRNKRAEQLGIVSWGIGCGTYPGVYTRVDMYLNWINKNRRYSA